MFLDKCWWWHAVGSLSKLLPLAQTWFVSCYKDLHFGFIAFIRVFTFSFARASTIFYFFSALLFSIFLFHIYLIASKLYLISGSVIAFNSICSLHFSKLLAFTDSSALNNHCRHCVYDRVNLCIFYM